MPDRAYKIGSIKFRHYLRINKFEIIQKLDAVLLSKNLQNRDTNYVLKTLGGYRKVVFSYRQLKL
jgi:hypothetical protein